MIVYGTIIQNNVINNYVVILSANLFVQVMIAANTEMENVRTLLNVLIYKVKQ